MTKGSAGWFGRRGHATADPFEIARRHSGRVRFLRKAIPVACALAIGGVIGIGQFRTLGGAIPEVALGPMAISGAQVTMEAPRLTGFRKDNRGYEVIAARASQDIRKPQEIALFELAGRMEAEKGAFSRIEAARGLYDTTGETLALSGGITITTDGGYRIGMGTARIAFKEGTVRSDEPVTVSSQTGTIDAQALEVMDGGAVIRFSGRVVSIINAQSANPAHGAAAASEPVDANGAANAPPASTPASVPASMPASMPAPAQGPAPAPPALPHPAARIIPLTPPRP